MPIRPQWNRSAPVFVAAMLLFSGMGCSRFLHVDLAGPGFDYFQRPGPDDVWSQKIGGWQRRERFDAALLTPLGSGPALQSTGDLDKTVPFSAGGAAEGGLRAKYFDFKAERRRALAADVAGWVQSEASQHYRDDGAVDHWATLEETLARGGDDCDGLELLAFHALRDLGFAASEVYRAIVVRPSDGQHHMVTLWFESPDDPWVIDPTGAMALGMPRMSELEDWVPIKVFSDQLEYTVRNRTAATVASLR